MGLLVDGVWQEDISRTNERPLYPADRRASAISSPPTAAPARPAKAAFPAEAGRYHLYVSLACPWAHRTLIFRTLKKLDDVISVSLAEPLYGKTGWEFGTARGGTPDTVNGKATLAEIYLLADPHYTGRVSVPVLWDKKRRTIVNNESSEIIRMLNSAFDAFTDVRTDYYPAASARRDRPHQRPRLSERQQRRLSRRLRHQPGTPTKKRPAAFSTALRSARSSGCRGSAIWPASRSPKPTGGCSPR